MSAGRESGISNPCEGWRLCVGCEPGGSDGAERLVEVEIANGVHISLCCSSDLGGVDFVMCDASSPGSAGFDQAFRFEEGVRLATAPMRNLHSPNPGRATTCAGWALGSPKHLRGAYCGYSVRGGYSLRIR